MTISFLEFGDQGKTLVFLHGWQQNKKSFLSLVPFLHNKYRLYFLDLPGFGQSEYDVSCHNSNDFACRIEEWLKEKKLNKVILVGHSFGGKVSTIIASKNPNIVSKLILIGSAGIPSKKDNWLKIAEKFRFPVIEKIAKPLYIKLFASRDYKEAGKLLEVFKTVVKEDLSSIFGFLKLPVLIIWGRGDNELDLADGERINRLIPGSKFVVTEGGHFPFWDNPKEVAEIIDKFV